MQQPQDDLSGRRQKPRLNTHATTLHTAGEQGLLRALKQRLARAAPCRGVLPVLGIGDDAAVLCAGAHTVASCDMVVEDVDFRRAWATWRDVGHKAAAINLSDMAAMGASPRGLVAGLAASADEKVTDMVRLLYNLHQTGAQAGAPLVGGDLSATKGPLVVSVTALGAIQGTGMRRHLGEPNDIVAVTGTLGGAAAGLALLEDPTPINGLGVATQRALRARQLRPNAQVHVAQKLYASGYVRSCADVSDGLGTDAGHVVRPGCGVHLNADAVPMQRGVAYVAAHRRVHPLTMALYGGEDFELVVAIAPKHFARAVAIAQRACVPLTAVGHVVAQRGIKVVGRAADTLLRGHGFDHYS